MKVSRNSRPPPMVVSVKDSCAEPRHIVEDQSAAVSRIHEGKIQVGEQGHRAINSLESG